MKSNVKYLPDVVLGVLLALFLALGVATHFGCSSPSPDPDNGVSNSSYRLACERVDGNLGLTIAKLQAAKAGDLSSPTPVHSSDWWDALILNTQQSKVLLDATLTGATFTASPVSVTGTGK